jgi:hypothetical protein
MSTATDIKLATSQSQSLALKMETVYFSEEMVPTYESRRRHNEEQHISISIKYIIC